MHGKNSLSREAHHATFLPTPGSNALRFLDLLNQQGRSPGAWYTVGAARFLLKKELAPCGHPSGVSLDTQQSCDVASHQHRN